MPGSRTQFDPVTFQPRCHEFWYSAVIRSTWHHGDEAARDLSRKVADWRRFSLWSKYDLHRKRTNILVMGCPPQMRQKFESVFQGNHGLQLQVYPMLVHAYFARNLLLRAYDFLQHFSDHLYSWEFKSKDLHSTEDYTRRVQAFLALSRQIQQITTDYDILDATLQHLKKEHQWFEGSLVKQIIGPQAEQVTESSIQDGAQLLAPLQELFDSYLQEAKLIRTYSNLYNERTRIGVSEAFAMINQRDAEVNIKMATESTQIARASHQDSRSLRIIQILSVFFLPASLVSSIFGMGFFSTSQGDDGRPVLMISSRWWIYVAVSIPLTIFCVIIMSGWNIVSKPQNTRHMRPLDLEKAASGQCKED
ncbi:MAG: hypothetical protein Q9217_006598 [Psora testacea]